ncbi:beta-1,6-N-acetylglucosaminyltransferase [Geothrix sp. PMB-07]|uniref:beta-1,6-N-acetylglucosaminyltransferase n=1 Tax=Geothrix sp. PMB-07 TaxID=3068640 RepID=UPI00274079B3|nr:beta-1,6-N-acetylglucosaminyltransferase [Geothrix sp. PMB-07]WLT32818.1 beta-1,6-N-acetylglucosaminyltransferase [Geothrix sp. PMB-07]
MKRHAYLVMAHENHDQLCRLLSLLDDERNDIYLQTDSKGDILLWELRLTKSKLQILKPFPIFWGGYSVIKGVLELLREATKGEYIYYHLLTGVDLPLVSQDIIHEYLENSEIEYINIEPKYKNEAFEKATYYHFFVEFSSYRKNKFLRAMRYALVKFQKIFGIHFSKEPAGGFHHGSAYFSISHSFALYVLNKEEWIEKTFRHGLTCDEVFMQTLILNSPFKERLSLGGKNMTTNLRYIDWKRREKNSPYTFNSDDFNELTKAGEIAFFARKFNMNRDDKIINLLVKKIKKSEGVKIL